MVLVKWELKKSYSGLQNLVMSRDCSFGGDPKGFLCDDMAIIEMEDLRF